MRNPLGAAPLQHMTKPREVGVKILMGMGNAIAHAGLRGKVNDRVELFFRKKPGHSIAVGDVHSNETIALSAVKPAQSSALEIGIVVTVEVIETQDPVTSGQQALGDVVAYETSNTRQKNML